MAVHRLPVLEHPAYCKNTQMLLPCPYFTCPRNLLVEVLQDGSIVLNTKDVAERKERSIADRHEHDRDRVWYVTVRLPDKRVGGRRIPQLFALGPCGSGDRARELASAWEIKGGAGSTGVHRRLPPGYQTVGPPRDGPLDRKFADLADDAIDEWFDEPDPDLPSCLEIERRKMEAERQAARLGNHSALLDRIADALHVSRERARQIEITAKRNFIAAARSMGLSPADLLESD